MRMAIACYSERNEQFELRSPMIERFFRLQMSGTNVKREIVAGCTTFMTLSYIIFV